MTTKLSRTFPRIGKRVLLLNACIVLYEKAHKNILLSIEDITVQRALERDKDELLRQKDVLLDEIEHRVANSRAGPGNLNKTISGIAA